MGRIKNDWPTSKLTQVDKIKPSDVDLWLSSISRRANRFGSASRKLRISGVKEVFTLALRDRIIPTSPAAHLRSAKREKPIRLTPTFEQFAAPFRDFCNFNATRVPSLTRAGEQAPLAVL